jgi:hypothetical protein
MCARFGVAPPPVAMPVIVALVVDLLIVVAAIYEWRAQRKPHPAFVVGAVVLMTIHVLSVPFSHTAAWHAVTDWLLGFA